jgi:hypothetical protein
MVIFKNGRGRPLISKKGNQRRRNITIGDCTYDMVKVIGKGNFSKGVRKLYDTYETIVVSQIFKVNGPQQ